MPEPCNQNLDSAAAGLPGWLRMLQERAALASRINRLKFTEYKAVGWFK